MHIRTVPCIKDVFRALGRSLQIFRALRVPINSRVLSDVLSRLVETIAGQPFLFLCLLQCC
jgi:hypothetical protein